MSFLKALSSFEGKNKLIIVPLRTYRQKYWIFSSENTIPVVPSGSPIDHFFTQEKHGKNIVMMKN